MSTDTELQDAALGERLVLARVAKSRLRRPLCSAP